MGLSKVKLSILGVASIIAVAGGVYIWLSTGDDYQSETYTMQNVNGEEVDLELTVDKVVDGLGTPWALSFVPATNQLLVTENKGTLLLVDADSGDIDEISGVPEVDSAGQGGLLDATLSPTFSDDNLIYLTYSAANEAGLTSTYLGRGSLDMNSLHLGDFEQLYAAEPFLDSTSHYGSRVVIDDDGYLYMSIGDRGDKNFADHLSQDTSNVLGSTIRLESDGSIPDDNPFVGDDSVADEIYTYGHRNVQGMAIHPDTGDIWQSEHGERDGDEINIIETGGNYGWPVTHTGCEYGTDTPLGDHPKDRDDIVDPVYYWECGSGGFPPAGMTFYDNNTTSDWRGGLFVGGLASEYLAHFRLDNGELKEQEPLLADRGWRIRDVVGGEDGALYIAKEAANGGIVRLSWQ